MTVYKIALTALAAFITLQIVWLAFWSVASLFGHSSGHSEIIQIN